MKLYFARHGESEGNARLLLYGWTDFPLTGQGREDGALLHEKLLGAEIKRCYASTLVRAAETARLALAGRDVPIDYLDGLREQFMGEFEDTSFTELLEKRPDVVKTMLEDWTTYPPPGGETYAQLQKRVYPCLDEIIERGEDALIVAHNGPLCAIFAKLLDVEPRSIDKFWFKHGCYSCVDIKDGRIRLEYFNR